MAALIESAMLFVGTRVGGRVHLLQFPDHQPSPELGEVLMAALLAARDARHCPHIRPGGGWVLPVATGRAMCVPCAFEPDTAARWQKGAACILCADPVAVLAMLDFWPDGSEKGMTRLIANLCPACVQAETGAQVRP